MAFIFYETPLLTVQYLMEDETIWIAPRSWIKTREALSYMAGDAHSMTLYTVHSPDFENPIDTIWIVDSDYGYRMASDDEIRYLDRYLSNFV